MIKYYIVYNNKSDIRIFEQYSKYAMHDTGYTYFKDLDDAIKYANTCRNERIESLKREIEYLNKKDFDDALEKRENDINILSKKESHRFMYNNTIDRIITNYYNKI